MSTAESWTVGKLLTWTTDYLKKNGSASPRLDAEVLLSFARNCQRIELYTAFDVEPDDEVKARFKALVKRRAEGEPVAYLVGYREFYSTKFDVSPAVLIPRPETEHLVVEALDCAKKLTAIRGGKPLQIVDVGTGSGAIAISLAKHFPSCQITAVDLSPEALQVAQANAEKLGVSDKITFLTGDLLEPLASDAPPIDILVSNPPYISDAEFEKLDKTVKGFEPKMALVAGPSGQEIIQRLAMQALERIANDGYFLFEFSPMLAERLPDFIGLEWKQPQVTKDFAGLARVVTLQKNS